MAGLPEPVILRAREILMHLESQQLDVHDDRNVDAASGDGVPAHRAASEAEIPRRDERSLQTSLFPANDPALERIRDELDSMDPDRMTPVEALIKLIELRAIAREGAPR